MGLHACNENCELHPDLHSLQRQYLSDEGGHNDAREERILLLEILKKERERYDEVIEILKQNV